MPLASGKACDKAVSVSYHVEERKDHVCYSMYTASVQICAANSSVGGDYVVVVGGEGAEVGGTRVTVKMEPLVDSISGALAPVHLLAHCVHWFAYFQ